MWGTLVCSSSFTGIFPFLQIHRGQWYSTHIDFMAFGVGKTRFLWHCSVNSKTKGRQMLLQSTTTLTFTAQSVASVWIKNYDKVGLRSKERGESMLYVNIHILPPSTPLTIVQLNLNTTWVTRLDHMIHSALFSAGFMPSWSLLAQQDTTGIHQAVWCLMNEMWKREMKCENAAYTLKNEIVSMKLKCIKRGFHVDTTILCTWASPKTSSQHSCRDPCKGNNCWITLTPPQVLKGQAMQF